MEKYKKVDMERRQVEMGEREGGGVTERVGRGREGGRQWKRERRGARKGRRQRKKGNQNNDIL